MQKPLFLSLFPDIDECELEQDNCHEDYGQCSNTPGHYNCSCIAGFSGDGVTCESMYAVCVVSVNTRK